MQRLLGILLTILGGIACLWAAYYILMGQSSTQIEITDTFSISAFTGGLAGAAVLTMGLLWMRD